MHDFLIVGAGVIGLSLAWELAGRGGRVLLVDRDDPGGHTSWAGAGILPPPHRAVTPDPIERLRTLSHDLHPRWAARLREATGIDNQLQRCGGIYLARQKGEASALRSAVQQVRDYGVEAHELTVEELVQHEPALHEVGHRQVQAAFRLPEEMQVRSPRNLKALRIACQQSGVELRTNIEVREFRRDQDRITGVETNAGSLSANEYCLTSGAWTTCLLKRLGWGLPVEPWRGQVILWKTSRPLVSHVINEGHRYLIPRSDGHLVVGATVEDVGFDCHTTEAAVEELRQFSFELLPELRDQKLAGVWAGLRPKTPDGQPFLGRVPGLANLSVATGHYRSGLHLAPATAIVMSQLLMGEEPQIELSPFRLNR